MNELAQRIESLFQKLFGQSRVVAAAGNNQGTATRLRGQLTFVVEADGTKGIRLYPAGTGKFAFICNIDNAVLKVYPGSADAIGAGAANAPYDQPARTFAMYACRNGVTWYPLLGAAMY